jgi:hypothetical protein
MSPNDQNLPKIATSILPLLNLPFRETNASSALRAKLFPNLTHGLASSKVEPEPVLLDAKDCQHQSNQLRVGHN